MPHSKTNIINEKYDSSNHSQLPGAPKLPNTHDSPGGQSLHGPNPVPSYQPIEMQNEPKLQSANHTADPITIDSIQQQIGEIGSKIGNVFQAVKSSGFNCFNSNPSPSSTSPPPHYHLTTRSNLHRIRIMVHFSQIHWNLYLTEFQFC